MARGWESKAVESQQQAADEVRQPGPALSAEESARQRLRATLAMARTKALTELQLACSSAHRAMLEQAIVDLDVQIARLDVPPR